MGGCCDQLDVVRIRADVGTIVPSDRGRRGLTYTLLTPANRYMSRLPDLMRAAYYKLVTPRLAPSRFGQALITAGEDDVGTRIAPGYERFMIGMSGESAIRLGDERIMLGAGRYTYLGQAQHSCLSLPLAHRSSASSAAMNPGRAWPSPSRSSAGSPRSRRPRLR